MRTDTDPLGPRPEVQHKTRYASRQGDVELAKANDKAVKASEHQAARPTAASPQDLAAEKVQAAPLGLNGDTAKKKKTRPSVKKACRKNGCRKSRKQSTRPRRLRRRRTRIW